MTGMEPWRDCTYSIDQVVISSDDLVDLLVEKRVITKPRLEDVFRKVHRGNYIKQDEIEGFNRLDMPWNSGTMLLHTSTDYAKALQVLDIQPGDSFLNIGSGRGYLSTMAGLLIERPGGVNHGVEYLQEHVDYARGKVEQFKSSSVWYDPLKFSEPKFFRYNIFDLITLPEGSGLLTYDKIFVGANCTLEEVKELAGLLKIGGTIVVPSERPAPLAPGRPRAAVVTDLVAQTRLDLERFSNPWSRSVITNMKSKCKLMSPLESDPDTDAYDPAEFAILHQERPVPTLKDTCVKLILQALTRRRYNSVNSLPISSNVKDILKGGREWDTPPPLKKLCL